MNHSTTLLASRNERDVTPDVVATGDERDYLLQGSERDRIGYSRQISAVDRSSPVTRMVS